MGLIYCATNKINGKCYVGQTTQHLRRRRTTHERDAINGSPCVFHRAIRKYGSDSFEWAVLFRDLDLDEMDILEREAIKVRNCFAPNGYNLTDGGNSQKIIHEETKQKLREAANRQFESQEARMACGKSMRGKKVAPEVIARRSATARGQKRSAETREKLRQKAIGRCHTFETKQKIAEAARNQKNRVRPPSALGKKRSEETKRRMREAQLNSVQLRKIKKWEQLLPTCFI